jgi:uncharacterized protein YaaR (DUF327 family)
LPLFKASVQEETFLKVGNIKPQDIGLASLKSPEAADTAAEKALVFKRTLTDLSTEQQTARLRELADRIDLQGQKLSKRADIKEFEKYRKLIWEFLDEVVSNGYAFSKENAFGAKGRHRFFSTVRTIDEKLDELAREILSGQSENIDLIHKIDDIRGLILDMIL